MRLFTLGFATVLVGIFVVAFFTHTKQKDLWTNETEAAFEVLSSAEYFMFPGIGDSLVLSEEGKAYEVIARSKNATMVFTKLANSNEVIAKLYGLCGLYKRDRKLMNRLSIDFLDSTDTISCYEGDLVLQEPLSKFTRSILSGEIPPVFEPEE